MSHEPYVDLLSKFAHRLLPTGRCRAETAREDGGGAGEHVRVRATRSIIGAGLMGIDGSRPPSGEVIS